MDKLKIKNNTKFYVACPANIATGGPELLHQLVHKLCFIFSDEFYN